MLEKATVDSLTGFFLRETLNALLENLFLSANISGKSFSIALVDLDHFKKFNDKYGHIFGDDILKYASSTLRLSLEDVQCSFFRYGGDEFIIVFPDKEPKDALRLLRQCSYNLVHRPFLSKNKFYKITFSCGIVSFPKDGKKAEDLIAKADAAMYFSKHHGRNLITVAGSVRFSRIRNIFLKLIRLLIIFGALFGVYKLTYQNTGEPTLTKIKDGKIVTKGKNLDTIVLKNGEAFDGNIIEETEDRIVLNLYLEKGEGTIVFKRSEISEIKRSSKKEPLKKRLPAKNKVIF